MKRSTYKNKSALCMPGIQEVCGCLLGEDPSMGGRQLVYQKGNGFESEKSRLMSLVDKFRNHLQQFEELPGSRVRLGNASKAVSNLKIRLEAKRFCLAIAGEAAGFTLPSCFCKQRQ